MARRPSPPSAHARLAGSAAPRLLNTVLLPNDPAWEERDWVNGYFPTGVPFRFRLLTCEADGCVKVAVACALEGDDGDWPYLFSLESDYLGDVRHDRFFCEEHLPDDS